MHEFIARIGLFTTAVVSLALLVGCSASASLPAPTDDPVASFRPNADDNRTELAVDVVEPDWVADLPWNRTVNIEEQPGQTDAERFRAGQAELRRRGGGVLYFPPGIYTFEEDIEIAEGVVLRGAAPGDPRDARDPNYALPSRLEFPKYEPNMTGSPTPIDTAFKVVRMAPEASNAGIVNLHVNRSRLYWPEADTPEDAENPHRVGRNRVVYGNIFTNTAGADPAVPDPNYAHHPHQRWTARHEAAVKVFSAENTFVANNRIPESGDDNFEIPDYRLLKPTRGSSLRFRQGDPSVTVTIPEGVIFDYDNRPGIYVNAFQMRGATPQTHPHAFRKGTIIRNNYIYATGRSAIHFTGDGTLCLNNVIRFPADVWRPTATGRTITDGGSTNDTRALTARGWRYTIAGNDYVVHSNLAYDRTHHINDGEGLMHEEHDNCAVRDSKFVNNRGNRYICIWRPNVDGLRIEGNTVGDDGDPAIHVLGSDRSVKNLTIRDNKVTEGAIRVVAEEPENIEIEGNEYTADSGSKIIVNDADWVGGNEGFVIDVTDRR
ncbi:MAG: hypothetical protein ACOC93_00265 [Planctomycetota bacterium]